MDLVKILKSMGLFYVFDATANFKGISKQNLFINNAFHKAFIEINETGTKAAASTVISAVPLSPQNHFCIDHPFIFIIHDNIYGNILFIGKVLNPNIQKM
jgi:serpin B